MRRGFGCLLLGSRDFLELGLEFWMDGGKRDEYGGGEGREGNVL